jgi:hypothetical protein
MALDPNIALGVRPLELPNQLAQYAQVSQIQNAQNQNALAQYQLGSAQRAEAKDIARTAALSKAGTDDTAIADALLKSGDLAGYTSFVKTRRETQKADVDLVDAKLKQSRSFLDTINPADPNAPAQYIAWHQANHADPVLGPVLKARGVTPEQSMARIQQAIQSGPQAFANLLNQSMLGTEKFMELNKPQYFQQDTGATKQIVGIAGMGGPATVVPGSVQTVTMTPAQEREAKDSATRIKQEGQRIGLEGRRVVVLEANAQRDKDPAFQQAMATARATGEAIAKNDVAAKQALPRILSDAQTALDVVDQMVGKQEVRDAKGNLIQAATKPHPGFQNAVGATWLPGARFVPGTNAAGFQALQDQIEGTAFLSAFEALKGGGAISEKEGAKATAARLRMTLAQDEKEYIKAAREFQDIVRTGVDNARRKVGGGASSAAPTNAANIDALLKKYE